MSFGKECVTGLTYDGESKGSFETIGGIRTYVTLPTQDYPKDKAVLFLTDVLGIDFINSRLLADDFAKNGFQVYAPDLFNGDALVPGPGVVLSEWLVNHGEGVTRPIVDAVLAGLVDKGITTIGATGYCFGGKYTFDLAISNLIRAGAVAHPSLLKIPQDLQSLADQSKAAILINSCETDAHFPAESCKLADEILGGHKPGYERTWWEGCSHGFAVRGDITVPNIKAGRDGTFKKTVEFFIKYL